LQNIRQKLSSRKHALQSINSQRVKNETKR